MKVLNEKRIIFASCLMFALLMLFMLGHIYRAHAFGDISPPFELTFKLPKDWTRQMTASVRDKSIRKYTNKHESIYLWNSMLEITHYYDRDVKDMNRLIKDYMFQFKDLCEGMNAVMNPGSGLSIDGAYWQFSCPRNIKIDKGEAGLIALIVGQYGLYEIRWTWRGPAFRPELLPMDFSKIPIPVSDFEWDTWFQFFASIKLKKIKRRESWE